MTKTQFTIIKGGLSAPDESAEKFFVSAFITDTRLMGVMGMHIHWELANGNCNRFDFHQFFYFDSEEYGLETYQSIYGDDIVEVELVETALIGGLGGNKVELTEKEACWLVQFYDAMNRRLSLPLVEKRSEYQFILNKELTMSPEDYKALDSKICTPILSDYHAINYFLMRCFGHDFSAAAYLCGDEFDLNLYDDIPAATLCKNSIDAYTDAEGRSSYLCESLIEDDGKYTLAISEITVTDCLVMSFEKRSSFGVSPAEAAMMLSRPEFVTLYDILIDPEDFDKQVAELTINTMLTIHENGRLFLAFNKNNNHVNQQIFRLNEDVYGLYYVTDFGQLIIAAYSISGIHALEKDLRKSLISRALIPTSKYEFKEPILYEFIQSGFEDFNDFLDFIRE